jgi:20S proteasome subunit beta 2
LGGVDISGPHLYTIHPHGSTDKLPFVTMGSGSLAAMAVFEAGYKDEMTEEEGKALVHKAISAGIFNDLGSGSNVDLCVIKKDKVNLIRGYDSVSNLRKFRQEYFYPKGTTEVIKTTVEKIEKESTLEWIQ